MYGKGINAYRQTNVVTADPGKLVIMCYEEVLKNLKTARSAYESKDYETKGTALSKVHDIVVFLMQSLDLDKGGDIAGGLDSLYNYILRRIMDGDLKKDVAVFDEIIHIFEELLASWKEISSPSRGNDHNTAVPMGDERTSDLNQAISGSFGA